MKRLPFPAELAYLLSIAIMSFSVAMTAAADFGVSMIVAPAYILSLKIPFLTFGQAEYVVQGLLFIVFCLLMRRVKPLYFLSFGTGLLYGLMLDCWRLIPAFDPAVTVPGSMPMPLRIAYLAIGIVLTSFAVALSFKSYLYPQVYDFFVKGLTDHYALPRTRFKQCFDLSALALSLVLSLTLLGSLSGIGIGTLVAAICNGFLIGGFSKLFDRTLQVRALFPRLEKAFALE